MASDAIDQLPILSNASLHTIDWAHLKKNDQNESRKLVEAGQTQGFFYLDMRSDGGFLRDWEGVLKIMSLYFDQDLDEKMKDSRQSDTHGYEPVGTSSGALKDLPDYYESLKASRREVLGNSATLPHVVVENHELFVRIYNTAHDVLMTILRTLSINLCLGQDLKLDDFHRDGQECLTTLSMFRYPKQDTTAVGVGHGKHTDLGSLTFLLCQQWGLQVLSRNKTGWHFVRPMEGHVVVNIGDTLHFLSGQRLRAGVHRVVPTRSLQHEDRYSIAYFLRAEDSAILFEDSNGRKVSAKNWHDKKFNVFRESHEKQEKARVLTGGMEQGGVLI